MSRMAQAIRPLSSYLRPPFHHRILTTISATAVRPNPQTQKKKHIPYSTPTPILDLQTRGIKLLPTQLLSELQESESNTDSESQDTDNKSRNQKKREARRAVQWGMELATFSIPQIKLILRAASLDQELFNAIQTVKGFGPDVREGKRRQFNYIGRLLREVEPELMNSLIQATKDGDQRTLKELCPAVVAVTEVDKEVEVIVDFEEEEEEEGDFIAVASRWSAGLIDKDPNITKEVYSIYTVEFDRQELRKLVRTVQNIESRQLTEENKADSEAALVGAKKSLTRFLQSLAKQMEQS